jgi:hypothetical protein
MGMYLICYGVDLKFNTHIFIVCTSISCMNEYPSISCVPMSQYDLYVYYGFAESLYCLFSREQTYILGKT